MRRKTNEEFLEEVYDLVKEEYTVLTKYELSSKKLTMRHNLCGKEYQVRPNIFLKGSRCPYCHGNKAKHKTTEQYKKEVYDLVGDEYSVLEDYINRETPILMKHNKCGRKYKVSPGNFLYRSRCIECYHKSIRLTTEEINNSIKEHLGISYTLVSEYNGAGNKVELLHKDCNKKFKVRYTDIIQKHSGCPYCKKSRGEEYIESYLIEKGIEYEEQKKFDDLTNIFQLSYDFYLPEYGILIEYQGEQHFRPKTFGGITREQAKERFINQKHNDKLKKDFANNRGYILWEPDYKINTYSKIKKYMDKQFMLLEVTQGTTDLKQ